MDQACLYRVTRQALECRAGTSRGDGGCWRGAVKMLGQPGPITALMETHSECKVRNLLWELAQAEAGGMKGEERSRG